MFQINEKCILNIIWNQSKFWAVCLYHVFSYNLSLCVYITNYDPGKSILSYIAKQRINSDTTNTLVYICRPLVSENITNIWSRRFSLHRIIKIGVNIHYEFIILIINSEQNYKMPHFQKLKINELIKDTKSPENYQHCLTHLDKTKTLFK